MSVALREPTPLLYDTLLRDALREDLGRAGDLTTDLLVPAELRATGSLMARAAGRICGVPMAVAVFRLLDPEVEVDVRHGDGELVAAGTELASLRGKARALLTAERTALNLLGHLSGIASATHAVVERLEGLPTRVACTRKTTPGLRLLEKYAVRAGGGSNHRFGLDDAVLIKDNHREMVGGVAPAIEAARAGVGHTVKIEIEVDDLDQLEEAVAAGADLVLLDNFSLEALRAAVARTAGRAVLEASGGITPETVRDIAATGVDLVSMGWLTHSAPSLDVALDLAPSHAT